MKTRVPTGIGDSPGPAAAAEQRSQMRRLLNESSPDLKPVSSSYFHPLVDQSGHDFWLPQLCLTTKRHTLRNRRQLVNSWLPRSRLDPMQRRLLYLTRGTIQHVNHADPSVCCRCIILSHGPSRQMLSMTVLSRKIDLKAHSISDND